MSQMKNQIVEYLLVGDADIVLDRVDTRGDAQDVQMAYMHQFGWEPEIRVLLTNGDVVRFG